MGLFDLFKNKQKKNIFDDIGPDIIGAARSGMVYGYRKIASVNKIAPTYKTTDSKIVEIDKQVRDALVNTSLQRKEFIPLEQIEFIVVKYIQVYELAGEDIYQEKLKNDIDKYLQEGLREEYKQALNKENIYRSIAKDFDVDIGPSVCYKMAYVSLPIFLFIQPLEVYKMFEIDSQKITKMIYSKTALSIESDLKKNTLLLLETFKGQLSENHTYCLIKYPDFAFLSSINDIPVLPPVFSIIIHDKLKNAILYFVLGKNFDGGTTLRSVNALGEDSNCGAGSSPNLEDFLNLIKDKILLG